MAVGTPHDLRAITEHDVRLFIAGNEAIKNVPFIEYVDLDEDLEGDSGDVSEELALLPLVDPVDGRQQVMFVQE